MFYAGGLKADLVASWFSAERVRRMEVEATRAKLVYDGSSPAGTLSVAVNGNSAGQGSADAVVGARGQREPLLELVWHFVDSIAHETRPLSDYMSGLRVVRVVEGALRSLSSGRRCAL